ncbi:MAG: hypothetical protein IPH95_08455 [Candidatus Promineofilum sp.]|nr:hypothetical protein [Promineifilum sp.]
MNLTYDAIARFYDPSQQDASRRHPLAAARQPTKRRPGAGLRQRPGRFVPWPAR